MRKVRVVNLPQRMQSKRVGRGSRDRLQKFRLLLCGNKRPAPGFCRPLRPARRGIAAVRH